MAARDPVELHDQQRSRSAGIALIGRARKWIFGGSVAVTLGVAGITWQGYHAKTAAAQSKPASTGTSGAAGTASTGASGAFGTSGAPGTTGTTGTAGATGATGGAEGSGATGLTGSAPPTSSTGPGTAIAGGS